MKDEDPTILKDFFSLVLLFSSAITHAFPWPIKGKAGRPMKGADPIKTNQSRSTQEARHEHSAEQQSSSQHPFTPFTRDLGSFPSLARLYLLLQTFSASNISSSDELDVGTFCLNQYKPRVL